LKDRPLLITLIIVIILLVLLVTTASGNIFGSKSVIGGVLKPVQGFFYDAAGSVAGFFSNIFSGTEDQDDIDALKQQLEEQESIIQYYDETLKENERLKDLLNFAQQNENLSYVTAKVISKSPGAWFNSFTISAGIVDGVKENMAVINQDGLIGRITEAYATWSVVTPIIDSDSSVAGLVERTRDNGILSGNINTEGTNLLTMSYLPFDTDIIPGDVVITSGLDGIFPKGIIIGEVTEVATGEENTEKSASVKPKVDFQHMEEVMVVISNLQDDSQTGDTEE